MSWGTTPPTDLDLHVVSVKRDDPTDLCLTYWRGATGKVEGKCMNGPKKTGCCPEAKLELDVDNTQGHTKGSETVTLGQKTINKGAILLSVCST